MKIRENGLFYLFFKFFKIFMSKYIVGLDMYFINICYIQSWLSTLMRC